METRVAVLAIIVRGGSSVQPLNELLHQYGLKLSVSEHIHQHGRTIKSLSSGMPSARS